MVFLLAVFMAYIIQAGNEDPMIARRRHSYFIALTAISSLWLSLGSTVEKDNKAERKEGEYKIYSSGKDIGAEKYVMIVTADAVTSSSTSDLRNPAGGSQKITLTTKLEMDGHYMPRSYEFKSEVDGQRGSIRGEFAPNQVIFEYSGGSRSFREGLLLGDHFTMLDTNVFHHFIFLARLFKYNGGAKPQTFDVVIPQAKETGTLKMRELNKETILIKGKKFNTTHLLVDSGALQIHLWVDSERIPRKIAVPDKGVEALHGN
jgi:hypothetical protein